MGFTGSYVISIFNLSFLPEINMMMNRMRDMRSVQAMSLTNRQLKKKIWYRVVNNLSCQNLPESMFYAFFHFFVNIFQFKEIITGRSYSCKTAVKLWRIIICSLLTLLLHKRSESTPIIILLGECTLLNGVSLHIHVHLTLSLNLYVNGYTSNIFRFYNNAVIRICVFVFNHYYFFNFQSH